MVYDIDAQGSALLGAHRVAVPKTVSAAAQAFLATCPWGEQLPPSAEPIPMWLTRPYVDEQMKALSDGARQAFPVEIEEMTIAGVRCQMVKPLSVPPENAGKILMNLHGGGFVLGGGSLVEAIPIAHCAQIPVLAVDYRLAPEHPYPAAVDDALAVYKTMLEYHRPGQIGVYGSSAGGFLTGMLMVRLQREGLPLPACCGVFTAGGDLIDLGDSAQIFTLMGFWGDLILPPTHPLSEIKAFVGDADPTDPGLSPIQGDLAFFPPTLLVTGTRDAVLSSTATFHRALRRAGVDAELYVFDAMPHAHWYIFHLPEAQEAIELMAVYFRESLATPAI